MNTGDNIYRLPPFVVKHVFSAQAMREKLSWGQIATGIEKAWLQTKGQAKDGRRVRIAIADTGSDKEHYLHGDLQNIVKPLDVTGRGPWCEGGDGHGVHVAGIVAARADDKGVVGFAPEAELVPIRCLIDGTGSSRWIANAIDAARHNGCHIVNLSLGSPQPDTVMAAAIERFVEAGGFVVCAAGNSGRQNDVNYPARWKQPNGRPNLDNIAVAAIDENGRLARYSSRGPEVDIAAPGSNVLSCWVNGGYSSVSGTSMAAPCVTGVLALMLARHWDLADAAATPLRTHDDVREHLRRSARDLGPDGRDDGTGWGLVKADELFATMPGPPEPPADPRLPPDGGAGEPPANGEHREYKIPGLGVAVHVPPLVSDAFSVGRVRG